MLSGIDENVDLVTPDLELLAGSLVGIHSLDSIRDHMNRVMLRIALKRTGGNYTGAARLLGVTRQSVQQMVSRFGLRDWNTTMRTSARSRSC